ncbi:hypothetical protein EBR77_02065 [bacterium]|nr:hypothetical protein [bacterium]NBX77828.1 hypothetical protein [bacterium]
MNTIKNLFLSTVLITGISCTSFVQATCNSDMQPTFNSELNTLVHQFVSEKNIKGKDFIQKLLALCDKHNLQDLKPLVQDVAEQINNLPKFGALLLKLADKIKPKVDQTAQKKIDEIQTKGKSNPFSLLDLLY